MAAIDAFAPVWYLTKGTSVECSGRNGEEVTVSLWRRWRDLWVSLWLPFPSCLEWLGIAFETSWSAACTFWKEYQMYLYRNVSHKCKILVETIQLPSSGLAPWACYMSSLEHVWSLCSIDTMEVVIGLCQHWCPCLCPAAKQISNEDKVSVPDGSVPGAWLWTSACICQ